MENYWDSRYKKEGKIWGERPSQTAVHAAKFFRRHRDKKLLVPGSGYGRNTRFFSAAGFNVTGVEISEEAVKMAREFDPGTQVYNISALDMSLLKETYDAVYCFNVLHLFREADRKDFIRQCAEKLNKNSLMFFTVFSENEASYGKGAEVEKNTYESKPGRPVHYFSEDDLRDHFKGMEIIETGIMEDEENHGDEGPHTHILRYICVKTK
jgi:2-polyprenyl-3-methyl-5-hydroxy-6-metoxy-1,4-benzoquinol methylase